MEVIATDKWLLRDHDDPVKICEKLEGLFPGADAIDIYQHLMMNGMYQTPLTDGKKLVHRLQDQQVWEYVQKQLKHLKQGWKGPDVPVFIFPSNVHNRRLKQESNGKAGLAFSDKLFLFVSDETSKDEIKALLIHEYSHVCRMQKYPKKEQDYVLLDSIVLEGLAEQAVYEKMGKDHLASWCKYYSDEALEKWWKKIILPNRNIPKSERNHHFLLYGLRLYPKMLGYSVGFHLVQKYTKEKKIKVKEMMPLSSEEIAQLKTIEA